MRLWIAAVVGAFVLFLYRLDGMGLVGPDEPRYAWIARAMAQSGDWVTPRLWGEPWFEKPVLLYWMAAAAFRLGWSEELAPRLPVACLSVAFLGFFFWRLSREFGRPAAGYATAVLATSAGWVGFSHAAVFDIPLTATLGAAMLFWIAWRARGETRALAAFGALLGASMLAKGLVGPVLAGLTIAVTAPRALRDVLRPAAWAPFAAVAAPWYVWCFARNGRPFLEEFFWKHHVTRFAAGALEHNQPFWFFLPVLLAGLLPWTPVYAWVRTGGDGRARFLAAWAAVTFVFFSLSRDKLPGYVLPALPPLAALAGLALARTDRPQRASLVWSAVTVGLFPAAAAVLPEALNTGLRRGLEAVRVTPGAVAAVAALAVVVWVAESRGRRAAAVGAIVLAAAAGYVWMKQTTFPLIDRQAGSRPLWRQAERYGDQVCVGEVRRHLVYGLQYYAGRPLPACQDQPRRYRIDENRVVLFLEP